jgi:uncharacterized membrane protein (UPF0127 family)
MRRLGFALFALFVSAPACSRTPPEPAPAPAPSPQIHDAPLHTTSTTSRCIAKLPETAPRIPPPAENCPADPEPPPKTKPSRSEMMFSDAPSTPHVEVEIAKSRHDVEKGLMFRRSMAENEGMIFKLDGRRDQTFWMQNTCIALDMFFIDDDGVIVGIVEGAAPLTETTRSCGCPSVFVLELNGGWARRHGAFPGQKVTIPFSAR